MHSCANPAIPRSMFIVGGGMRACTHLSVCANVLSIKCGRVATNKRMWILVHLRACLFFGSCFGSCFDNVGIDKMQANAMLHCCASIEAYFLWSKMDLLVCVAVPIWLYHLQILTNTNDHKTSNLNWSQVGAPATAVATKRNTNVLKKYTHTHTKRMKFARPTKKNTTFSSQN